MTGREFGCQGALDGLLEQESALRPVKITSDTHGASEIVFGLFRLVPADPVPRTPGGPCPAPCGPPGTVARESRRRIKERSGRRRRARSSRLPR
ncbi:Tn3 family transposase [Streptomyces sp. NBC_00267]|uniref:Tn3 family transposase n=1 Tax=unclassified Streptomyces TaxID=2593676 RepID=UPI003FA77BF5